MAIMGVSTGCTNAETELCEQAQEHVEACFGTELSECSDETAAALLSQSCEEMAENIDPTGKSDGYCPSFLWFLCDRGPEQTCPSAGRRADYRQMSNDEQMNYHWEWMACTEYGSGGNPEYATRNWDMMMDVATGLRTSFLRLGRSFSNETDELDEGRVKMIHPYGSVAQVEFSRTPGPSTCGTEYTGIWSEDRVTGLARLGWGAPPQTVGYLPGMGLKFFVEGRPSVNLHVIEQLDADPNAPNFFEKTLTNILPAPQSAPIRALAWYFGRFADNPLHLRLEHVASVHSDGTTLSRSERVAPLRVEFVPSDEAYAFYQDALDADADVDFREVFAAMPAGTALYDVYLTDYAGCREAYGQLTSSTEFRNGSWGDKRLYFQHAREGQGI